MGQYWVPVLGTEDSTREAIVPEFYAYSHDMGEGLKLMEHSYLDAQLPRTVMVALKDNPRRVVWAGDYADVEEGGDANLYDLASGDGAGLPNVAKLPQATDAAPRFIINHDRMMYVDLTHCPTDIHPLPLLTSDSNGRGGGDYRRGTSMELVGSWARDLIETSDVEPHGFVELRPDFTEE